MDRDVKFNARVVHAEWVEDDGKWTVKIEIDGKLIEDKADVIINASGVLKYVVQPPSGMYSTPC